MKTQIYRADSRGRAEHGWLHSRHTFSFASYYDPERMGFGKLRVINDDIVDAGAGFGTHPHDNMEIISIPLSGTLKHRDSMGHEHIIQTGEIQIMSAGTGLTHSEFNASDTEPVNFLQIWVKPKFMNIKPRYDQKTLSLHDSLNRFDLVVSPDQSDETVWINQDAWFSLGKFDKGITGQYQLYQAGNGVYLMVLEGNISIGDIDLARRDGFAILDTDNFYFTTETDCQLLLIEVPA